MSGRLVSFPAGAASLHGWLHVPDGPGPFPALVWNHGSEPDPGSAEELGRFYTSIGFVLFSPHRRGHGRSPGEYAFGSAPAGPRSRAIAEVIGLHERALDDTLAAARWLASQTFADSGRLVMSGVSHGGVQTLLAAEVDAGMQAYVPFAPAAIAWEGNPEIHERLLSAVRRAFAPIFLLQAENDYSLGPSLVLGEELVRKGPPNRAKVYPAFGSSPTEGHGGFACRGTDVWGEDVRAFLSEVTAVVTASP